MNSKESSARVQSLDKLGHALLAADERRGRRRRHVRGGAAVCATLSAAALAFTAPGQAVAEHIGSLVGIGDEPSDRWELNVDDEQGDLEVVGIGETPSGTPFELTTSTRYAPGERQGRQTCVYVSFPDPVAEPSIATCLTPKVLDALTASQPRLRASAAYGPAMLGADEDLLVEVIAPQEAAAIQIEYVRDGATHEATVTSAPLIAGSSAIEGTAGHGSEVPVLFSVAFLPSDLLDPARTGGNGVFDPEELENVLKQVRISATDDIGGFLYSTSLDEAPAAAGLLALPGDNANRE